MWLLIGFIMIVVGLVVLVSVNIPIGVVILLLGAGIFAGVIVFKASSTIGRAMKKTGDPEAPGPVWPDTKRR